MDADTGEIIAADLTSNETDDGSQVGPLLDQVTRPIASFTGDGAFDRDDVYGEVAERHPEAAVIVPSWKVLPVPVLVHQLLVKWLAAAEPEPS